MTNADFTGDFSSVAGFGTGQIVEYRWNGKHLSIRAIHKNTQREEYPVIMVLSAVTTALLKQTCYQLRLRATLGRELDVGIRRPAKSKLASEHSCCKYLKVITRGAEIRLGL